MLFIYRYVGVYVLVSKQKGKLSYFIGRGLGETIIYSKDMGCIYKLKGKITYLIL